MPFPSRRSVGKDSSPQLEDGVTNGVKDPYKVKTLKMLNFWTVDVPRRTEVVPGTSTYSMDTLDSVDYRTIRTRTGSPLCHLTGGPREVGPLVSHKRIN